MKNFRTLSILLLLMLLIIVMSSDLVSPLKSVRGKMAGVPLATERTPAQTLAANLALRDERVLSYTAGDRTELFGVREVGQHYPASSAVCASAPCQQVEIYNFDENAAIIAIVNPNSGEVLDVFYQPEAHPGINQRLADLATRIALNHPTVIDALGFQPTAVSMAPVDGGLLDSACLTHLCVAPTFEVGDRNLWVIIDLTEEKLLKVAWTDLQPNEPHGSVPFSGNDCPTPGSYTQDGWEIHYEVTGTDGLRVYDVSYNGVSVLRSVKLAEWHAMYSSTFGFEDYTGCGGGGGGFPIYPYGDTQIIFLQDEADASTGFEVRQDFRMSNWGYNCNYRYEQRVQFFADGRFRIMAGAYGRDCGGGTAMYRPLIRIDLALDGDDNDLLASWDGSQWVTQNSEFWELQGAPYTAEGYRWRIADQTGFGYYMAPNQGSGTVTDPGDNAYFYAVQHHPAEGDADLPIIGDCCATGGDYRQGPHLYLNGESIVDENLVLWYVPQMQASGAVGEAYCWTVSGEPNPESYPCFGGPTFHPINLGEAAPLAYFSTNSPAIVGETAVFTNLSQGSIPMTTTWDFGDGTPTNLVGQHVYTATGVYTATLQASNAYGSGQVALPVLAGIAGTSVTPAAGGSFTYTPHPGQVVTVSLPAGAVDAPTTILLDELTGVTPPTGQQLFGPAFSLTAYRDSLPLSSYALLQRANLALQYRDEDVSGLLEDWLTLSFANRSRWQDVISTCAPPSTYLRDTANNTLAVDFCQLGDFAYFGLEEGEEPGFFTFLPLVSTE